MSATAIVQQLKQEQQDFEWYPTTDEIIDTIKQHIGKINLDQSYSVLDCGAGDGRVLNALATGKKYAIEKSKPLLSSLSRDIFVVGTDFHQQTLMDKSVDVLFSNPPYSEFSQWMLKIIKETRSKVIYFVAPKRWKDNVEIQDAIESRKANAEAIGSFDFEDADRKARAKVDIVFVDMQYSKRDVSHTSRWRRHGINTDPFTLWFNESFQIGAENSSKSEYQRSKHQKESATERVQNALVSGGDIVACLEQLYTQDLDKLISNYRALEQLDASLLDELDVNLNGLREAFDQKIRNLKDLYWRELFNNLTKVTERLTKQSRERLLGTLTEHTHVDFTIANAHAILEWVVKNSNFYLDDQLIALVERMTNKANIRLYKSNQKTFGEERWRYCRQPNDLDNYKLDLRIVLQHVGGINTGYWKDKSELAERARDLLTDIQAVANNIGFDTRGMEKPWSFEWVSKKKNVFHYRDAVSGEFKPLMSVTAFKNGNLHINFNQVFMCKLNVEFGRLKGWLKTAEQAAEEVEIPVKAAQMSFHSNELLTNDSLPMLSHSVS